MKIKILTLFLFALTMGLTGFAQSQDSSRIGMLDLTDLSEQEESARAFFIENFGEGKLISNVADINKDKYDCIWIHLDRYDQTKMEKDTASLKEKWPEIVVSHKTINAIKRYIAAGGNLYLSGHATQLLYLYGRLNYELNPETFSNGRDPSVYNDTWSINTRFKNDDSFDRSTHAIYNELDIVPADNGRKLVHVLYGGGRDNLNYSRVDHNSLWVRGDVANFERTTNSVVLGCWGQDIDSSQGIVEFLPIQLGGGTIIANGIAGAQQWKMLGNEINDYEDNIKKLTSNILSYLASNPNRPEGWFDESLLYSSKKVALYVGYEKESDLNAADNREGKAVYNFFKARYPQGNIIFKNDYEKIKKEDFACVWIHLDRPNVDINDGKIMAGVKDADGNVIEWKELDIPLDGLVSTLKAFHEAGGNIYLSKQATFFLPYIHESWPAPDEKNYNETKEVSETWHANINYGDENLSEHPIFQNLLHVGNYGRLMIEITSGDNLRQDNTSVWRKGTVEGIGDAKVTPLATWGHNDGDAMNFYGMIELKPSNATYNNVKRRSESTEQMVKERQGIILANGFGGYEWVLPGGQNESIDQIHKLTENILDYLSPVAEVEEKTITVTNFNGDKISEAFDPKGYVTVENAITFDTEVTSDDIVLELVPVNNASGWKTYIGNEYQTAYSEALTNPVSVYTQWAKLGGAAAVEKGAIDGFYNGDEFVACSLGAESSAEVNGTTYYSYAIEMPVPCSGLYTLSIKAKSGQDITITNNTDYNLNSIDVEIYPNLYGAFGIDQTEDSGDSNEVVYTSQVDNGFNINGYTFVKEEEDYVIYVPEDEPNLRTIGYIPGTYFSSSLTSESDSTPASVADETEDDDEPVSSIYFTPVDITELKVESVESVTLYVTIEKNGASHEFPFVVKTANSSFSGSTTGLDAVDTDNAEPVYYNLQGIRVANPERGLFIKIEGKKVSKVII